ncbi:helix-hairpin-helix domain-containing protein [Peptococcus simiae]|uniref:helix-hairpin-helix domain-containing protein n=1 Tax=Peptococcus simiae TaxID=1643805 RepID=UPI0039811061
MDKFFNWLDDHGGRRTWAMVILALLLAGVWFWQQGPTGEDRLPVVADTAKLIKTDAPDEFAALDEDKDKPTEATVHVSGAVAKPGVYTLSADARVNDAIQVAGGPLPEADLDALNLAQPLIDGTKIAVPRQGEAPPAPAPGTVGTGSTGAGAVSINAASVEELQKLPGIGPAKAQAIVAYREAHGGFRALEELKEVSGIGDKTYERLAADIQL